MHLKMCKCHYTFKKPMENLVLKELWSAVIRKTEFLTWIDSNVLGKSLKLIISINIFKMELFLFLYG